jgi:hypothetical protein
MAYTKKTYLVDHQKCVLHISPDQGNDYVVHTEAEGQELNGDLDEIAVENLAAVVSALCRNLCL